MENAPAPAPPGEGGEGAPGGGHLQQSHHSSVSMSVLVVDDSRVNGVGDEEEEEDEEEDQQQVHGGAGDGDEDDEEEVVEVLVNGGAHSHSHPHPPEAAAAAAEEEAAAAASHAKQQRSSARARSQTQKFTSSAEAQKTRDSELRRQMYAQTNEWLGEDWARSGYRCDIYWDGEDLWYPATLIDYNETTNKWHVQYDEQTWCMWEKLREEWTRWHDDQNTEQQLKVAEEKRKKYDEEQEEEEKRMEEEKKEKQREARKLREQKKKEQQQQQQNKQNKKLAKKDAPSEENHEAEAREMEEEALDSENSDEDDEDDDDEGKDADFDEDAANDMFKTILSNVSSSKKTTTRGQSPSSATKKSKVERTSPPSAAVSKKKTTTTTTNPEKSSKPKQQQPLPQVCVPSELRDKARQSFADTLTSALQAVKEVNGGEDGSQPTASESFDAKSYANDLEEALATWAASGGVLANVCLRNYKTKLRSIVFNIRDAHNPDLKCNICALHILPARLATMSTDEMASKHIQSWRRGVADAAEKQKILHLDEESIKNNPLLGGAGKRVVVRSASTAEADAVQNVEMVKQDLVREAAKEEVRDRAAAAAGAQSSGSDDDDDDDADERGSPDQREAKRARVAPVDVSLTDPMESSPEKDEQTPSPSPTPVAPPSETPGMMSFEEWFAKSSEGGGGGGGDAAPEAADASAARKRQRDERDARREAKEAAKREKKSSRSSPPDSKALVTSHVTSAPAASAPFRGTFSSAGLPNADVEEAPLPFLGDGTFPGASVMRLMPLLGASTDLKGYVRFEKAKEFLRDVAMKSKSRSVSLGVICSAVGSDGKGASELFRALRSKNRCAYGKGTSSETELYVYALSDASGSVAPGAMWREEAVAILTELGGWRNSALASALAAHAPTCGSALFVVAVVHRNGSEAEKPNFPPPLAVNSSSAVPKAYDPFMQPGAHTANATVYPPPPPMPDFARGLQELSALMPTTTQAGGGGSAYPPPPPPSHMMAAPPSHVGQMGGRLGGSAPPRGGVGYPPQPQGMPGGYRQQGPPPGGFYAAPPPPSHLQQRPPHMHQHQPPPQQQQHYHNPPPPPQRGGGGRGGGWQQHRGGGGWAPPLQHPPPPQQQHRGGGWR
ncbi:hypothetical protein PPROV_000823900 [Pycnococcus provasolii]|uniref:TFIIS central domain-containing protein n=1 Tax=Pycnococcus provasolii TaxID=41880 RepID=A0A830HQT8_9CHLO|nr:hypothetical protein PPROV_000823900 [Pycnococcus provasolii]